MDEKTKYEWLKKVLLFNIFVAILLWGLPLWLAPKTFLTALGITVPGDLFYMRIFGVTELALAYLYYLAYQNLSMNRDIIRFAVIVNAATLLTLVGYQLAYGIKDQAVWFSAVIMLFLAAAYYMLTPSTGT